MHRPFKSAWLWPLGVLLALGLGVACIYDPSFDDTYCGLGNPPCPEGTYCDEASRKCLPGDGPDGCSGPDCADADGGQVDASDGDDAGGDPTLDGADETPDGGDPVGDGGDEAADGGDEAPDGGDDNPACGGPCQHGSYCNTLTNVCERCEVSGHCGSECLECPGDQGCQKIDLDFCCLSVCDWDRVCQIVTCGSGEIMCLPDRDPRSTTWVPMESVGGTTWCPLAQKDGILPESLRCDPADDQFLLFNCPWDGRCQADMVATGICAPAFDLVRRQHDCGEPFRCADGHCQLHYAAGQACTYNFDCESYCCSRETPGTCLADPGAGRANCKISNTYYRNDATWYTFHAIANNPGDPGCADNHNRDCWWSESGQHNTACTFDAECDSQQCNNFSGNRRCGWSDWPDSNEDSDLRTKYFYQDEDLGNPTWVYTHTNSEPEPTVPADCTYDP